MLFAYTGRSLSRRTALHLGSLSLASMLGAGRRMPVAAAETSALPRQREIVYRLFASGINTGDEAIISSLHALSSAEANVMPAPAGMPIPLSAFFQAAPGVRASVDALVAEGDLVAARITWRVPHPPAGTHIAGQTMHLFQLDRDLIVAQWASGWEWLEDCGVRKLCNPANPLITP